jgi:DNA/RNA-binding domain of Phe-tRNA-synthetase-like protein
MRDVRNPSDSRELEAAKRDLEHRLRTAGDISDDPTLRAYADYYRARGQTYHVRAQRDSVARKNKPIPTRSALVEAMFMAELDNLVLTAGHDLDRLVLPVRADASREDDRYVTLSGKTAELQPGDMLMRDGRGIISSVLRGPDQRTPITADTRNVLFAVYAPTGIDDAMVQRHLREIEARLLHHTESQVRCRRGHHRLGAFEPDRRVQAREQGRAGAE